MSDLPARIKRCAKLTGRFVLRSGNVSDTYFDKYQFEADPQLLRDIAVELAALVPDGTQVLAGLEMGGIPIVTMLSQVTGLPAAFIRKQPKEYGTCRYAEGADLTGKRFVLVRYAEGADLTGKRFVLVEDVVSSGGAIIDFATRLRADGFAPDAAICVVDRLTGGREMLAAHGLPLHALFTLDQIERA